MYLAAFGQYTEKDYTKYRPVVPIVDVSFNCIFFIDMCLRFFVDYYDKAH